MKIRLLENKIRAKIMVIMKLKTQHSSILTALTVDVYQMFGNVTLKRLISISIGIG